MYDLMVIRCY